MDKAKVKAQVEQIQSEVIKDLEQAYARDVTSADIDETETKDPEDFSHQGELNEMARRIELRLKNSQDELKYLQKLSSEARDTVGEGALVETNKYVFFVAIATHPFEIGGKTLPCATGRPEMTLYSLIKATKYCLFSRNFQRIDGIHIQTSHGLDAHDLKTQHGLTDGGSRTSLSSRNRLPEQFMKVKHTGFMPGRVTALLVKLGPHTSLYTFHNHFVFQFGLVDTGNIRKIYSFTYIRLEAYPR